MTLSFTSFNVFQSSDESIYSSAIWSEEKFGSIKFQYMSKEQQKNGEY